MDRDTLLGALRTAVEGSPWIEAAWVGGSDATMRTDTRSDIDLQILVPVPRTDDVFLLIEGVLLKLGGIACALHIPFSEASAERQRFYRVKGVPEHLMVDLCVMRRDKLAPFLDPDRHGTPVIWVDPEGIITPTRDLEISGTLAGRRANIAARTAMFAHIPAKSFARGHQTEAYEMWNRILVTPLVEMLRARLCPERQDFGLRYLDRDLPPDVLARLEALILPDSTLPLGERIAATRAWLEDEIDRSCSAGEVSRPR